MKTKDRGVFNTMLTSILHLGPNETIQLVTIEEKVSAINLANYRALYDKKQYKIKQEVPLKKIIVEANRARKTAEKSRA